MPRALLNAFALLPMPAGARVFGHKPPPEDFTAVRAPVTSTAPPPVANGSIFPSGDGYAALYEGTRARRVADAQISYTGKGDVARASRQGWLSRFFSVVSPF